MKNTLFRKESIDNKINKNYGVVRVKITFYYFVLSSIFLLLTVLLFLFITFGKISEKFVVKGYLNSTLGVVRIYPNKHGFVTRCFVHQGDKVKKGEKLFLIDTSYQGDDPDRSYDVLNNLEIKKQLIQSELDYKRKNFPAFKSLWLKHYISRSEYHKKKEELLSLEHRKNLVEMEIIKYQQEKSYAIRSPIDGIISSLIFQEGQYINDSKQMAKILPNNADLVAELFIPVKQAGFLRQKSRIRIRYDAYPYERFGSYLATIESISESTLTDKEEDKPISVGQPYYKVTARLDQNFIQAYGQKQRLQHGMTLTALVVGSQRKIWQWILDPIYSFYGELLV